MNNIVRNNKGRQMIMRILLKQKQKRNFISPRAVGLRGLNKPNPLGRWSVDKEKYQQDSIVDWANHDHCGSESCTLENEIKEIKDWEKFIEKEKKEKEEIKYFTQDDYVQNYMTAFII